MREPAQLSAAVARTLDKFERIDFVICGAPLAHPAPTLLTMMPGAAGNFLAPIGGLSENAFRTVISIDLVRPATPPRTH